MELRAPRREDAAAVSEVGVRFGLSDETAAGHRSLVRQPRDEHGRGRSGRRPRRRDRRVCGRGRSLRRRKDPLDRRARRRRGASRPARLRRAARAREGRRGREGQGLVAGAQHRVAEPPRVARLRLRLVLAPHADRARPGAAGSGLAGRDQRPHLSPRRRREGRVRRAPGSVLRRDRLRERPVRRMGALVVPGAVRSRALVRRNGRRRDRGHRPVPGRARRGLQRRAGSTSSACASRGDGAGWGRRCSSTRSGSFAHAARRTPVSASTAATRRRSRSTGAPGWRSSARLMWYERPL